MNTSTLDSPEEPVDTPLGGGSIGGFGYGLGLSLAVLAIFMIITYASYRCKRRHPTTAATTNHHHHRRSTDDDYDSSPAMDIVVNINQRVCGGLDEATISSYPRYTYSQIKPHKSGGGGGGAAATCSICLADYKDSDLLRLLPQCCHLFHLKCVDPWLLLHPTCPVCRKSPPRGGQPPPLAQPAPVTPQ
ncbi:hypothetical protein ABFX02_06G152400 [Erythranthe guttata]